MKEEEAQARKKLHHSLKERLEEEEGEIIHRRHVIEDRKQVLLSSSQAIKNVFFETAETLSTPSD